MIPKMPAVQERDGSNNPLVSYTRGNNLSGSMEGLPRERDAMMVDSMLTTDDALAAAANPGVFLSPGKGGIGGLLARSDGYSSGNFTTHNYYFADGNGSPREMTTGKPSATVGHDINTRAELWTRTLSHGVNIT